MKRDSTAPDLLDDELATNPDLRNVPKSEVFVFDDRLISGLQMFNSFITP